MASTEYMFMPIMLCSSKLPVCTLLRNVNEPSIMVIVRFESTERLHQ